MAFDVGDKVIVKLGFVETLNNKSVLDMSGFTGKVIDNVGTIHVKFDRKTMQKIPAEYKKELKQLGAIVDEYVFEPEDLLRQ